MKLQSISSLALNQLKTQVRLGRGTSLKQKLASAKRMEGLDAIKKVQRLKRNHPLRFLGRQVRHFIPMRYFVSPKTAAHETSKGVLRVHSMGGETRRVLTFPTKQGSKTMKIYKPRAENVKARFKAMQELASHGAPVTRPRSLRNGTRGERVWIEDYAGINVNELIKTASLRQKAIIHARSRKAIKEVKKTAKKLGLRVFDVKENNVLYDPETNQFTVTDLQLK